MAIKSKSCSKLIRMGKVAKHNLEIPRGFSTENCHNQGVVVAVHLTQSQLSAHFGVDGDLAASVDNRTSNTP